MSNLKNMLLGTVLISAPIWGSVIPNTYVNTFGSTRTAYEKNCAVPGAEEYLKLSSTRLGDLIKDKDPHQTLNHLQELSKSPSLQNCQDSYYKHANELFAVSRDGTLTGIVGGWFIGLPILAYRMKKEKKDEQEDNL